MSTSLLSTSRVNKYVNNAPKRPCSTHYLREIDTFLINTDTRKLGNRRIINDMFVCLIMDEWTIQMHYQTQLLDSPNTV